MPDELGVVQFETAPTADASGWVDRAEFWLVEAGTAEKKLKRRERNSKPLILTGHGASLRVDNGALIIRDGLTHYPQTRNELRFFRGDLALPPRILLLDGTGTLSFDVLTWLADQGVTLARVTWQGEIAIVTGGYGFSADPQKVAWQIKTRDDTQARMAYAKGLIRQKLANSTTTMRELLPAGDAATALHTAQAGINSLDVSAPDMAMDKLRAIEGECAGAYFAAWKNVGLKWKGLNRQPIPHEWQTYRSRSSILTGVKAKNKRASHPINAMLNYAYAVRKTHLQIDAIADGYDPRIGIMHHSREDFDAFIYDLIEPERPKVDAAILAFIQQQTFTASDFVIRSDGACRLSQPLAKVVAGLVI